jgi:pyruvate dehydrogenase E2 component (dihydrolipoamide acetyltransferase)
MTGSGPVPGRGGRIKASPRARRALSRLGIDPHTVTGTGPGGRIVEADVLGHHSSSAISFPSPIVGGQAREPSKRRRAVARMTAASFATVPHFHLRCEIDAGALVDARTRLLPVVEAATGVKLSFTDFFLAALARALRDCPWANQVWHRDALVTFATPAVGLVVGLDDGLLIPVFGDADRLGLGELARWRGELVTLAREGRLGAGALGGAVSSLSNLGDTRVDDFSPVLAPSQSSMLAVGRIALRPFVVDGQVCARPTVRLCLAVDHRVMDGEPAARFLGRIVECLERPAGMFLP